MQVVLMTGSTFFCIYQHVPFSMAAFVLNTIHSLAVTSAVSLVILSYKIAHQTKTQSHTHDISHDQLSTDMIWHLITG